MPLFLLFILPTLCHGAISDCGLYEIQGEVRVINTKRVLSVNSKTLSEYLIYFPASEEAKLALYDNRDIKAQVYLLEKLNGTVGNGSTIEEIESRIPNPLNPQETGFKLIRSKDCTTKK